MVLAVTCMGSDSAAEYYTVQYSKYNSGAIWGQKIDDIM